ncbi:MAG: flagella basal body P-ring formation protein FlgA [Alphaproteobacteria bacterium]|nr:MAG: flagella basal body P-ring formation protein FlgA [Alphaproteobacteria bacterium]
MKRFCTAFFGASMVLFMPHMADARPQEKAPLPPYQLMLQDVEDVVGKALAENNVAEIVKAHVLSERKHIVYAAHHPVEVELAQLTHDSNKRTWTASMVITDQGKVVTARPLSGRFEEQKMIPVLVERIHHGDIIAPDNIRMIAVSTNKIRHDVVTDAAQLEGKTSRSTIAGGRIIRGNELVNPAVIRKGAAVSMTYNTPTMHISTVGEALEDGGMGDMIRVRNSTSSMVVRAKILSSNEVSASLAPTPSDTALPSQNPTQHSSSGY